MACGNSVTSDYIKNLLVGKDFKSRYFDGVQANGLYGLDLFLNFYQNNVNRADGETDLNATANFVRNPNCWAYDIDLTCCSPWNMHPTLRLNGGILPSSSHHMAGTLISPRHVIFCQHDSFYPPAGSLIRFVTKDNQTVTKTITALQESSAGDFTIGVLDSNVPPTITFARILPDNWRDKFAMNYDNSDFAEELLGVSLNQDKSVLLRRIQIPPQIQNDSVVNVLGYGPGPVDAMRAIRKYDSGSPTFLIVDNTPIIVTTFFRTTSGDAIYSCRHAINDAMLALGGGYTLTPANLDAYSAFLSSERGRAGVGVVQPQSGLDYPLVAPTEDVRYLIADFELSFDDLGEYGAGPKVVPPLKIKYLYNVGCVDYGRPEGFPTPRNADKADIQIVDSAGTVVFDTFAGGTGDSIKDWGADYKLYSWKKSNQICSLLAYKTWQPDAYKNGEGPRRRNYDKYLAPVNAQIDSRAVYKMPKRLRSLSVKSSPNCNTVCGPYTGRISFRNGFNTTLTTADTTINNFRVNTAITFSAIAGSGAGKYSSCPDTSIVAQSITKINGATAPGGDFVIAATDCLWAKKPTTRPAGAAYVIPSPTVPQQIGGNCGPCCKCEDYAAAAEEINRVQAFYVQIGDRVNNVKFQHEANIERWLAQQSCSINPLKLLLVPQRCPYMDVVAMICNPCQECINNSLITVSLTPREVASAEVVAGKTAMYAKGVNGRPVAITKTTTVNQQTGRITTQFSAPFNQITAGANAYLQFRVKFSVKGPYTIDGTLTAVEIATGQRVRTGCADSPATVTRIDATAIKSETLFCTADGKTVFPV